jgi:hypothetical protein
MGSGAHVEVHRARGGNHFMLAVTGFKPTYYANRYAPPFSTERWNAGRACMRDSQALRHVPNPTWAPLPANAVAQKIEAWDNFARLDGTEGARSKKGPARGWACHSGKRN